MSLSAGSFEIKNISFENLDIRFAEVKNPEKYFDELLKNDPGHPDVEDERIPYWCELWPSSIALSGFLVKHPALVRGRTVLEIGCGLGLSGIVATALGGMVTLTDYIQDAIDVAAFNWKLNFESEPAVKILDWREPENFGRFEVLLASDVAYESRSFKSLIKAIKLLLKKDGIVLISEPNRKFSRDFFDELKENGFHLNEESISVMKDNITYRISVYLIRYIQNGQVL